MDNNLTSIAQSLRDGTLNLIDYLTRTVEVLETEDAVIQSFLPEEGRLKRLLREAAALQERFPTPGKRPPLFGVPVGVKDIYRADGFPTKCGSQLPAHLFDGLEAECVTQLKLAGALVLGKTVSTEFAYFSPGPTHNPHNPAHTPGGSSSGSAAAVAAGFCPLSLGSQTIGSIMRPAAYCGVVGFKPTYARISAEGVIPVSTSVDTMGYFTSGMAGVALVASLLCTNWQGIPDVNKPVLGVPDGPYLANADDEGLRHFESTCSRLQNAGYTIKRIPAMADFEDIDRRHRALVAAEAAQVHQDWYDAYLEHYQEKTKELIEAGKQVTAEQLEQCLIGCWELKEALSNLMKQNQIDLWISPSAPGAAPYGLDATGSPVMNLPWNHARVPVISLPAGKNAHGLPMGLQLAADWDQDELLVGWARYLEETLMST